MVKSKNNTVIFPRNLNKRNIGDISQQIKQIVNSANKLNKEIYLDVGSLYFIEPLALVILFDQVVFLKAYGLKVFIANHTKDGSLSAAVRYMDDSEFFLHASGKCLSDRSKCRTTTLPITSLAHNQTLMWLENTSIKWLASRLGTTKESLADIKICLEELFNNTKDHSGVKISTALVQHFPKKGNGEIKICVSDLGIGLVKKIQKTHPDFTAFDCICHAIQEGFTTQSSHRNAGMGLFTLACTVCNNGGKFILRTGEISATVFRGTEGLPSIEIEEGFAHIDGTAFEITLYQDKLDLLQAITENFSWD